MSDAAENIDSTEESGSLLSGAEQPQEEQSPEESAIDHRVSEEQSTQDDAVEWGDRPDWMPENFWSDEEGPDIESMAKSYQELRAKMSAGKHNAPKDGKYDISSLEDAGVTGDDPLLSQFSEFAKDNGLSQDQFEQITSMYVNSMMDMEEQATESREAEMAKLGPKGDKVIASLDQWLGKLGNSGALAPEEVEAIANSATSATFIRALDKIRQSYGEKSIPDLAPQETGGLTRSDLDAMVADPRYGKDMNYTNNVERKFMEFFGEA